MNYAEIAEKSVLADHENYVGKVILATMLSGYLGETDDSVDLVFKNPIRVLVGPALRTDLVRIQDDWLDPVWNVAILDEHHPELPVEGLRSCWLHGTSYNWTNGDIEPANEWRPSE